MEKCWSQNTFHLVSFDGLELLPTSFFIKYEKQYMESVEIIGATGCRISCSEIVSSINWWIFVTASEFLLIIVSLHIFSYFLTSCLSPCLPFFFQYNRNFNNSHLRKKCLLKQYLLAPVTDVNMKLLSLMTYSDLWNPIADQIFFNIFPLLTRIDLPQFLLIAGYRPNLSVKDFDINAGEKLWNPYRDKSLKFLWGNSEIPIWENFEIPMGENHRCRRIQWPTDTARKRRSSKTI